MEVRKAEEEKEEVLGEGQESPQGESSGGTSDKGSNSNSQEDAKKYELKANGVLTGEKGINWDNIKTEVENLYEDATTITLDMYKINTNQDDILNFNKEYDNLTMAVKEENKENTLNQLTVMYEYIPKFARNATDDEVYSTVLEIKSQVVKAYALVDKEDWEAIGNNVKSAIDLYSKLLTNVSVETSKQYIVNKGYVMLNELQNAVSVKDKDVFLIKYKNLMQELNNL